MKGKQRGATGIPAMFDGFTIRRVYDEKKELWYFSVIDIIRALIQQPDYQTARKYWNKLAQRLREEGSEVVTNCHQLKLLAPDGKMRETDCANTETMFRIVQSVPSPKAESLKRWLAKTGYERIQEIENPELAAKRIKKIKGLKRENLRDHMTDLELIFSMLGEAATTEIARTQDAQGFTENKTSARKGGRIAGEAREKLEVETGEQVVNPGNYLTEPEGRKRLKHRK